jgi:Clostripain family
MAENDRIDVREIHPRPAAGPKQKWTVMVYLAGDNNLTANCISVLQQLEAVKYDDSVCVLACFDSNTPWPKGSRYLAINCRRRHVDNGLNWEIHNDLIPPDERGHKFIPPTFCSGNQNGENGEPMKRSDVAAGLSRFVNWAMNSNKPSERYMLILYGHGPVVAGQSFLARDNPPSSLRLRDLQHILSENFGEKHGRKLDILACQNCVMNGIETAYEVRNEVKYMIGSQGLVLASGWPYERIITSLVDDPTAPTEQVARKLLKACAKNLLDFVVMDRSSEQSACNIERLLAGRADNGQNIVTAVEKLANALREGLEFHEDKADGLKYPVIADLIKLARLEAQSYWAEIFADLYDFCERLLKKCNEAVITQTKLLASMGYDGDGSARFEATELPRILKDIINACIQVTQEIEGTKRDDGTSITKGIVEHSYFIGSDLQYSHGLSIFFPWTMPAEPYFFTKSGDGDWVLKTAFETYRGYHFSRDSGWAAFLVDFFKATLRKVRRSNRDFFLRANGQLADGLVGERVFPPSEVLAIDLQKSSSDTGKVDHDVWSTVKNYPRRNYLSPTDCARRIEKPGRMVVGSEDFQQRDQPPVSYLGWNISGLVAEVVGAVPAPAPQNGGGNGGDMKAAAVAGGLAAGRAGAAGGPAPKGAPPSPDV